MEIKNYKTLKNVVNPHGIDSTKIYDKKHALIMHLSIDAGKSLKPHITPVDVAFYILEGAPHIMIDNEKIQVKKDDLVESPKNIVHCIYNETQRPVRVLVMKLPKPTTETKFV